ncbi:MAG: hypothetical protein D3925_02870, partial [Candidatus Electrothrix sp. AR5]|nr:hypothetical protein [Candidatus Electrothrix sp. AR5]
IFSKPVNVEYYKRPGPNEMLNNQLNIINWEPVDNEEESILAATIQVCKKINSGKCMPFTYKDDSRPISITLETMKENSQGYTSIRNTNQGKVRRSSGELYITSFVEKPANIKQWLVINYVNDDKKKSLSEIADCFVDIGRFVDAENQEDRTIQIDVSQLTKDLPKLTSEGKTTESCNTEAQQTELSTQYMSSDAALYAAEQKESDKKQAKPEGIIVNIKPDLSDEGKIQVAFLAKEKFFTKKYEGKAVLRQQGFEEYINFSLQGNSYVGTSEYVFDTGIADVGFQTDLGVMRAYNRFEVFNSESDYSPGFPSPGGELQMSAPEGSFEGSGKFIITSSSITPPSNGKLSQVGNVWSFGFADSITAVYNVSFNILIDGTTQGLDATKLNLYGWNQEEEEWEEIPGGSNDLKEFNISLDALNYDSYALFAPISTDTEAPEAVTGFQARTSSSRWGVDLSWTAPRDNRNVYVYDIRFDTKPITEETWEYSIPIGYWSTPKPGRPGSAEKTSVNMPDPATEYYFAIRSADAAGNWSDLTALSSPVKSRTPGTTPSSPSVECAATVPDNF